jgi:hypothetical protein
MSTHLLVDTADDYAKRVPVEDIPLMGRDRKGVRLSKAPIPAMLTVKPADTGRRALVR